ncbi:hypothetical protein RCL1_005942 [Eukaryota sp. TZLM3-RCL]
MSVGLYSFDDTIVVTTSNTVTLFKKEQEVTKWVLAPGTYEKGFTSACVCSSLAPTAKLWAVVDDTKIFCWLRLSRSITSSPIYTTTFPTHKLHPFKYGVIASLKSNELVCISEDAADLDIENRTSLNNKVIQIEKDSSLSHHEFLLVDSFSLILSGWTYIITVSRTSVPNSINITYFIVDDVHPLTLQQRKTIPLHFEGLYCCAISSNSNLCLAGKRLEIINLTAQDASIVSASNLPENFVPKFCSAFDGDVFAVASESIAYFRHFGSFFPVDLPEFVEINSILAFKEHLIVSFCGELKYVAKPNVKCLSDLLLEAGNFGSSIPNDIVFDFNSMENIIRDNQYELVSPHYVLFSFLEFSINSKYYDAAAFLLMKLSDVPSIIPVKAIIDVMMLCDDVTFPFSEVIDWTFLFKEAVSTFFDQSKGVPVGPSLIDPNDFWNTHVKPILIDSGLDSTLGQSNSSIIFDIDCVIAPSKVTLICAILLSHTSHNLLHSAFKSEVSLQQTSVLISEFEKLVKLLVVGPIQKPCKMILSNRLPIWISAFIDAKFLTICAHCDSFSITRLKEMIDLMSFESVSSTQVLSIINAVSVPLNLPNIISVEEELII